ncbi:MAG: hypothetical protein JEZ12_28305 [Desulfobacterium sp.]|nr:hypothetical protein [Desulfobacterium sp.]
MIGFDGDVTLAVEKGNRRLLVGIDRGVKEPMEKGGIDKRYVRCFKHGNNQGLKGQPLVK